VLTRSFIFRTESHRFTLLPAPFFFVVHFLSEVVARALPKAAFSFRIRSSNLSSSPELVLPALLYPCQAIPPTRLAPFIVQAAEKKAGIFPSFSIFHPQAVFPPRLPFRTMF